MEYHPGITCSYCKMKPIKHTRYACLVCKNHNLCETCSSLKRGTGQHQSYHPTQKVPPMTKRRQQQVLADPNNAMLYTCPLCGDQGFTARKLQNHVDQLHLRSSKYVHCPICTVCQEKDQGQCDIVVHLSGHHAGLNEASQGCSVCSSALVRFGCLTCENYQLCSKCRQGKSFTKGHRASHPVQEIPPITANRANLENQLVVCPYCGKGGYTTPLLANHCSRVHSSDTSAVRCPVCIVRRDPSDGFGTLLNSKEPGQLHKHLLQVHNWTADELECSICIDKISAASCRHLSCSHSFHVKCIAQWLVSHTNCPVCRKVVVVK